MFAATTSVVLVGVEPRPVRVEVHVGGPKQVFSLVGLPDIAVREAKERVRAAVTSSGYEFPKRRVTVNLAPANLPKAGSAYDLPIALGVLAASRQIAIAATEVLALGELALDGTLRAARGGLGAGIVAAQIDVACVMAPEAAAEAALVEAADVRAAGSLAEAVSVALGETSGRDIPEPAEAADDLPDLAEVRGQGVARRALEIAAAGGHHVLLTGPPGAGKTMLAKCLPGLLPKLTSGEALDVAQAWAASGLRRPVPHRAPFRSPHHSATLAALIGGGSGMPVPGEVSLAHRGVLFLDELGEFPVHLLDGLRQPIEDGEVCVARKGNSVRFPCSMQVVGATNPCPCGYLGDQRQPCRCTPSGVARYRRRLSGPLLDRFDIRVAVPRLDADSLLDRPGESSGEVRSRVEAARERQVERGFLNRAASRPGLDAMVWDPGGAALLRSAVVHAGLSGRGWDRVRRVARTIADLAGADTIAEAHVAEALAFRGDE